jgi:hypothetical protein
MDVATIYSVLGVLATALAAWLLWRAAVNGLRRFVRNLWPH